jgi:hypothetical protein
MSTLCGTVFLQLFAQAPVGEAPEVKYNVALIAAIASIVVAVISACISILGWVIARMNQSALQRQQAELNLKNQTALTDLQARLTLQTQLELEKAKANLAEGNQTRLEKVKADLAAQNQQELEFLRVRLGEQGKDRDARRDYQYEAHKRLYTECEPLLFQLAELAEHAYYRIYSLARTARLGSLPDWLSYHDYYKSSTMYKLVAPLVVFRLIQQRLTFVDLSLDSHIANQYRLLKFLYLTFTDAFDLANIDPKIEYYPDADDWEILRKENPEKYWRQGMYLGVLDTTIDALLEPKEKMRWKTYGEFESEFKDRKSTTHTLFLTMADILHAFHPKGRPVFWRMLWTQSLIYKKILESQSSTDGAAKRVGLGSVSPKLPLGNLDWRQSREEASDDEVLIVPEKVAQMYLRTRLPEGLAVSIPSFPECRRNRCENGDQLGILAQRILEPNSRASHESCAEKGCAGGRIAELDK